MNITDYLNRRSFIDFVCDIIENASKNKKSISFAIDGNWGCGKSFVLNMLEDQLSTIQSPESASEKYAIFHYNCWQYDYYDEPLIAIVSMMINTIEQNQKLLSSEDRKRLKGIFACIGSILLSISNEAVKNKYGIDLKELQKLIEDALDDTGKEINDLNKFNPFWSFSKALEYLKKSLMELAEQKTIIFVVDELDRCLPHYAIKVLERLHHLTEETNNIVTVVSVDKSRLLKSVASILGYSNDHDYFDSEKYLKKFIDFVIHLDYGEVDETISHKYFEYLNMFNDHNINYQVDFDEFVRKLFKGIDMREQEHIFDKCLMIHSSIVYEKCDYSVLYMELFFAVLYSHYNVSIDSINNREWNKISNNELSEFMKFFEELNYSSYYRTPERRLKQANESNGVWQIIEWYSSFLMKEKSNNDSVGFSRNSEKIKTINVEKIIEIINKFSERLMLF